jgi:WD40 repeat protein
MFNPLKDSSDEKKTVLAQNQSSDENEQTVLHNEQLNKTIEKPKTTLEILDSLDWQVKEPKNFVHGDLIDERYLVEKVFSGGMGYVYIAKDTGQNIWFAIKQPNKEMLSNKSMFSRIINEANIWTDLGIHPHIAFCYFVKLIDDIPYIFIEYVDGGNLREWIADGKCLDIGLCLDMCIQFCHGMEHAHSKNMKHRDIKPENILMTSNGQLKITDFGLAGQLEKSDTKIEQNSEKEQQTQIGDIMGTKAYMSPEQWEDPHNVDERADIFSFGVCMWEMFCGRRPYLIAVGNVPSPPNPKDLRSDLPDELIDILTKSISLLKENRQINFKNLREELNNLNNKIYFKDSKYYQIEIPDNLATDLNNRGYSYYQIEEFEKAMEYWHKAIENDLFHLEANYNYIYFQWNKGIINKSQFENQMKFIEFQNKHNPLYWLSLGWFYLEIDDLEKIKGIQNSESAIYDDQFLRILNEDNSPKRYSVKTIEIKSKASLFRTRFSKYRNYAISTFRNVVYLLEISTGNEIKRFEYKNQFLSTNDLETRDVIVSPDDKYLVLANYDNSIRIIELFSGKEIRSLEHTSTHLRTGALSISFDSKYIISGDSNQTLHLWDFNTGKLLNKTFGNKDEVNPELISSICFSPDNKLVISGAGDKIIRVWAITELKQVLSLGGHLSKITALSISPNGNNILSGGYNGEIIFWGIKEGKMITKIDEPLINVTSICFSPDGNMALSGHGDGSICLWLVGSMILLKRFESHKGLVSVCFSVDSKQIISSNTNKTFQIWDINHSLNWKNNHFQFPILSNIQQYEKKIKSYEIYKDDLVRISSLINNERYYESYNLIKNLQQTQNRNQDYQLNNFKKLIEKKGGRTTQFIHWFERIKVKTDLLPINCYSPDGRLFLYRNGSWGKDLHLSDIQTRNEIQKFIGHTLGISTVCFSQDGKHILSGSEDKTIRLWDISNGAELIRYEGHSSKINSVCFSPDGKYVLSGSDEGPIILRKGKYIEYERFETLILWDAKLGNIVKSIKPNIDKKTTSSIRSVSISPNSKYGISTCSSYLILWGIPSGEEIRKLQGHIGSTLSVCFSPNGKCILSGGSDGVIILWSIDSGEELKRLSGHSSGICSVCFSPDGKYALSGSYDRTIRIWDIQKGIEIKKFDEFSTYIVFSWFSPDGKYILTAGAQYISIIEIDWEYEFPDQVNWHEDCQPFCENFLTLWDYNFNQERFDAFYEKLQYAGLGWVRKEGILNKLKEMGGKMVNSQQ